MKDTFTDDSVVTEMKDFLVINIDTESETGKPIAQRFGVGPLPTLLFLNADGSVRDVVLGYLKPADFKSTVQRIRQDKGTIGDLKRQSEAAPKDVGKRAEYAMKLKDAGDVKGYEAQVDEILKLDPERKNPKTSEIAFDRLMAQVDKLWQQGKTDELPGMISAHLSKEKNPEILFRGWATLSSMHEELGRQAKEKGEADDAAKHATEAFKARATAWKTVPDNLLVPYGSQIAWDLYERKDAVSAEDKAFALEVATKLHPKAEEAKDVNALDTVACVYFWNGKKDEALAVLRKCIGLDPKNMDIANRIKEFSG